MAVRVACELFDMNLANEGMGNDETGRQTCANHRKAIACVREHMKNKQFGPAQRRIT